MKLNPMNALTVALAAGSTIPNSPVNADRSEKPSVDGLNNRGT